MTIVEKTDHGTVGYVLVLAIFVWMAASALI